MQKKPDYIQFANDLIPGQGTLIVEGWEALQEKDVKENKNRKQKTHCIKRFKSRAS